MHVNSGGRTIPAIVTATPGSREPPFGAHAALRHNEGHLLIEPSHFSRAPASRAQNLLILWPVARCFGARPAPPCKSLHGSPEACLSGGGLLQSAAPQPSRALFSPDRLRQLVGDLGTRHPAVLKLALAHGGEVIPGPRPLAPDTDDGRQFAPDRRDHRRPGRTTPAGRRDGPQPGQLAALAPVCGNGPSAFSVRIESQYSLISLILPSSSWNTRQ